MGPPRSIKALGRENKSLVNNLNPTKTAKRVIGKKRKPKYVINDIPSILRCESALPNDLFEISVDNTFDKLVRQYKKNNVDGSAFLSIDTSESSPIQTRSQRKLNGSSSLKISEIEISSFDQSHLKMSKYSFDEKSMVKQSRKQQKPNTSDGSNLAKINYSSSFDQTHLRLLKEPTASAEKVEESLEIERVMKKKYDFSSLSYITVPKLQYSSKIEHSLNNSKEEPSFNCSKSGASMNNFTENFQKSIIPYSSTPIKPILGESPAPVTKALKTPIITEEQQQLYRTASLGTGNTFEKLHLSDNFVTKRKLASNSHSFEENLEADKHNCRDLFVNNSKLPSSVVDSKLNEDLASLEDLNKENVTEKPINDLSADIFEISYSSTPLQPVLAQSPPLKTKPILKQNSAYTIESNHLKFKNPNFSSNCIDYNSPNKRKSYVTKALMIPTISIEEQPYRAASLETFFVTKRKLTNISHSFEENLKGNKYNCRDLVVKISKPTSSVGESKLNEDQVSLEGLNKENVTEKSINDLSANNFEIPHSSTPLKPVFGPSPPIPFPLKKSNFSSNDNGPNKRKSYLTLRNRKVAKAPIERQTAHCQVEEIEENDFKINKSPMNNIQLKSGKGYKRSISILRKSLFLGSEKCYNSNLGSIRDEFGEDNLEDSLKYLSLDQRYSLKKKSALDQEPVTAKEIVFRKCGQTEPLPFSECFPDNVHCHKIGEGVYGEVFLLRNPKGDTSVTKIVPVEGDLEVNGERQKRFDEILSEVIITMELSNLRNNSINGIATFIELQKIQCVRGRYPDRLILLWKEYDKTKGSENDCPDFFKDDQLYIIFQMADGGGNLESFEFNNAMQSYSMFQQIAIGLAVAEEELSFEHRDLHWGNVLVSAVDNRKMKSFYLDKKLYQIPTNGVEVAIIDFTLSRIEQEGIVIFNDLGLDSELFNSEGDYQFDVYRLMQQKNRNNWKDFEPFTNLLWLDYILDKAITALKYKNSKSKRHRDYLGKLKYLRKSILSHQSVKGFIMENLLSNK